MDIDGISPRMLDPGFYNMDKEYVVYRHISPSGKSYIGMTSNYTIRVRDKALSYKNCPVFYRAIKKYGWDSFRHEILCTGLSLTEAEAAERRFIQEYRTTEREHGYNICAGGDISKNDTPERREKISASLKQYNANNKGERTRINKASGEKRRGKPLSEEHKKALRKNHVGMTGRNHSEETKRLMSELAKERRKNGARS